MFSYQIVLMFVLVGLCFRKASFWGAFTLYILYAIYFLIVIPLPGELYYSFTAAIALSAGLLLHRHYFVSAICSYSLVLVNVLGYWLYENMYDPFIYDNIYQIILIIQVAALTLPPGALLNGLRRYLKHSMAKFTFFNGS